MYDVYVYRVSYRGGEGAPGISHPRVRFSPPPQFSKFNTTKAAVKSLWFFECDEYLHLWNVFLISSATGPRNHLKQPQRALDSKMFVGGIPTHPPIIIIRLGCHYHPRLNSCVKT